MLSIVYRSVATRHLPATELIELCITSAEKNARSDITGFLVQYDGVFLQVLEGQGPILEPLIETIRADDRHTGFNVLCRDDAARSLNFGFWSMNIGPLDDADMRRIVLADGAADFAGRSLDPDYALTVLTRAYLETCWRADVDPAARDLRRGVIPNWVQPTHVSGSEAP
ncbi:BLUF domain-containing protein [Azospirillum sp.]|uniref:BLUF domain-containing protein n=1 Tax=Azospirillum sp. TaxID=34012 RepID=UPI003D7508EC